MNATVEMTQMPTMRELINVWDELPTGTQVANALRKQFKAAFPEGQFKVSKTKGAITVIWAADASEEAVYGIIDQYRSGKSQVSHWTAIKVG